MDVDQITTIASVGVDVLVILRICTLYGKYRYPTLRLFLAGLLIFVIADLEPVTKVFGNLRFGDSVIFTAVDVVLRMGAVFLVLFVYQSAFDPSRYKRRTVMLACFLVIIATGVGILASMMKLGEMEYYAGLGHIDYARPADFSGEGAILLVYFIGFLFLGGLMIVGQICLLILMTRRLRAESQNPAWQSVLKDQQIGYAMLIIGSLFAPLIAYIADIIMMAGFVYLMCVLHKKEYQFLYEPALRHLTVMDTGGLPVFSYTFDEAIPSKEGTVETQPPSHLKDLLYTGAIKGISSLLGEIMGSQQAVEQISMSQDKILIRQLPDKRHAILLFTRKISRILYEAVGGFAQAIQRIIDQIPPNQKGPPFLYEEANAIVLKFFGPMAKFVSME